MKRPTFITGVVVAAVLAFFASAIVATLTPFVGLGSVVRLAIPAMGLAYLLWLFSRSTERLGRVTALTAWTVMAAITWWVAPPIALYLLIHVTAIWLIRSLYFYSGVMPALMDLGLSALSITATVWALTRSGSIFLATWCFFLVHALFVVIPPAINKKHSAEPDMQAASERFDTARRQADEALRILFTERGA
jgi:hypothetical protein